MKKHVNSKKYANHASHDNDQALRSRNYIKAALPQSKQELRAALQDLSTLNQRIHMR